MMQLLIKTLKKGCSFKEGMIADGFYIVIKGSFKILLPRPIQKKNLQSFIKLMITLVLEFYCRIKKDRDY